MQNIFDIFLPVVFFLFGAIIGSFLNVVILRYRSGRTLSGRSICFTCGKTLKYYELVPIASFFSLGGRCDNCQTKISWQYPAVEALTGLVFMLLYFRFEQVLIDKPLIFFLLFAYYALISSILIILSVYDIKHRILPDGIVLTFAIISFVGMFFVSGNSFFLHMPTLWHFLAGLLLPLPFTFLWVVSKGKWMGLGDSKFMIGIGFLLGLSSGILAILLAFWLGALFGILFLIGAYVSGNRGVTLKTAIPFGPFLAIGTILVILMNCNVFTLFEFLSR